MDLESVKRYLEGERRENDEDDKANESKVANLPPRFLERFVTNGLKVDLIEPGRIVCSMKIPPHLLNAGNFLHGGATATLVDLIGSAVIYTAGVPNSGVSVEINVSYLDAAFLDEEIEIESKTLRVGKAIAVVSVELRKKMNGMVNPSEGTRDVSNGGCKSVDHIHLLLASLGGLAVAAAAAFAGESFLRRRKLSQGDSMGNKDEKIAPLIERKDSGRRSNLERFSHYVARQLGFENPNEYPLLCKLANAYLMKTKGYDENVYEYLGNEAQAESLYVHLLEEFERCILTYFAFNWTQSSNLISQVLSDESDQKVPKLKDFVMAATRKQRFERVSKDLKVTRVISTLVKEMKAIRGGSGEPHCTEVMSPVAHNKRSPVLLLMGGGMGAGKSTVLKDILQEAFWSEAEADAVVIEADAFKETDVIYRALSSRGHHDDMLQTAELVHQSSTDAASSLLVTALNEGRDVIMDGTLSWEPFVEQMIEMARNVHKHRYRMGAGYKVSEDGTITEEYWKQISLEEEARQNGKQQILKPYRIELVGVVCDAYLAVARGIRRAVMVKRAVRVKSQLDSHKRFANAFPKYCELVDNARLYCTNAVSGPPRLIAWKDGNSKLLVDPEDIECLKRVSSLNPEAESIYELYSDPSQLCKPGSVWKDVVLVPSRPKVQKELSDVIRKIEKAQTKN